MNSQNLDEINQYEFPEVNSHTGLITKLTLFFTLLSIYLMPWGDAIWDGTPRVAATIALGLSFIYFLVNGTQKNYTAFHVFIALYIAWQVIGLIWTPDMSRGEGVAKTSAQLILLSFMFTLVVDTKEKIQYSYQVYVLGNLTGSGIIVYNFLNGIQTNYYARYGIANVETDTLSVILAVALPMAAYLATKPTGKVLKLINVLSIPIIFYAIFLTGTRTGSIVGIIGILYWIFTYRKSSFSIKILFSFLMVSSVIAIFTFAPQKSIDRVFSAGESISSGTLNSRTIIWGSSINKWKESPIIGVGTGGLGFVLSKENLRFKSAHNTYVHLLAENGIIGLLLYLLILFSLFYYIIHTPFEEKAFLIALLMTIVVSQISTHTQEDKFIWFAFTMIALHSLKYSLKSNNH